MLLEINTDIKAKMDARNPVWMEPRPRYTLKVSLSMLRTTDIGLKILQDVAKGKATTAFAKAIWRNRSPRKSLRNSSR